MGRDHRWAAVAIAPLDAEAAQSFAAMDGMERLERVCETFGPAPGDIVRLTAVRGPICADCRVPWETVHHSTKAWPCPGPRPDALGGTLLDPVTSRAAPTRQQRRQQQRKAEKLARANERHDAGTARLIAKARANAEAKT